MATQDTSKALFVPKRGDTVTFVTPQQKRIPGCKVVRVFDGSGRVRVKSSDGNCYSGTLEQIDPS